MAQKKVYDKEFKIQAVKLGREIGFSKAAKELGVNIDTLYEWNKRAKDVRLDLGPGNQTPDTALSLTRLSTEQLSTVTLGASIQAHPTEQS